MAGQASLQLMQLRRSSETEDIVSIKTMNPNGPSNYNKKTERDKPTSRGNWFSAEVETFSGVLQVDQVFSVSVATRENDYNMNSMKFVSRSRPWYWSIHTKDESKRRTAFAFIFGVN